ncbi:LysM domain-containing protein [Microterricola gilva]|uniref:LysM domain-containing protein n=1 Tax=Microterricola gilva TaxID=393267 RepID=A0A4Q8APG3_9MICO|nr:LysM domain-containing protein [Microterricola gilva]RZU66061.1 LysM domain-containing protein [Microterricola gilva]
MTESALSRTTAVRFGARHAVAMGVALASALAFTGCSGAPAAPPATVFVTVEPTAEPTPTPTPEPPAAEPPAAEAPIVVEIEPNAPAAPVEPGPANDLGLVSGAMGPVTTAGDGALLTYTVVSGDAFFDIAQRFDLPQQQLLKMNPSIPSLGTEIYIGQIVNLDWTTTR